MPVWPRDCDECYHLIGELCQAHAHETVRIVDTDVILCTPHEHVKPAR